MKRCVKCSEFRESKMKEVLGGWITRDQGNELSKDSYFWPRKKPYLNTFNEWEGVLYPICLEKHHGLKPGEIKKAQITIDVE